MRRDDDDLDDRPRPRKKKKKKPPQGPNSKMILYISVGASVAIIFLMGVGALAAVLLTSSSSKLTAPTEFGMYNSQEDVFHVELPKDWKIEGSGVRHAYWVEAKKGSASIKVEENAVSSLVGDIMGAVDNNPNKSDDELPVSKLHELKRQQFGEGYSRYEEEPAVTVRTGFGKSRRSAFSGKVSFIRKYRGYRVTTHGVDTQITVVCTCPAGDWDMLEPAFARVIESLGPGSR
jgi:hypothetical protein